MENTELKNLQLETKDFDLLIQGLENLPNKDMAGEMMVDMLSMAFAGKDEDFDKNKLAREREERKRESAKAKEALVEDIKILQSKLILLKRYLVQNNLLKDVENILRK